MAASSSSLSKMAPPRGTEVTLLNARLIVEILLICRKLRDSVEGDEKDYYGIMDPGSSAAQMIAYLESDEAKDVKSVDQVIEGMVYNQIVVGKTRDADERHIAAAEHIIVELCKRYPDLSYVAGQIVKNGTETIDGKMTVFGVDIAIPGGFIPFSSAVVADGVVLAALEKKRLVPMVKSSREVSFRAFKKDMEQNPDKYYPQLVEACTLVQKYFELESPLLDKKELNSGETKKAKKAMKRLREQLKKDCGSIGVCLDDSLRDKDAETIRAIFAYSKYVTLEREVATAQNQVVRVASSKTSNPSPSVPPSSKSSVSQNEKDVVLLFNKRFVVEIIAICDELGYQVIDSRYSVASMIAYLENPKKANALSSPGDVIIQLKKEFPVSPAIMMLIHRNGFNGWINTCIAEAQNIASGKIENFKEVDSGKAAKHVLDIMKKQHGLIDTVRTDVSSGIKRENEFAAFLTGMDPDKNSLNYIDSCEKLNNACSLVQKYITNVRILDGGGKVTDKNGKDLSSADLREKLGEELPTFGTIGEYFNNERTIGGKKGSAYPLKHIDMDSISAIFAYSKHVAVEKECRMLLRKKKVAPPTKASTSSTSSTSTTPPVVMNPATQTELPMARTVDIDTELDNFKPREGIDPFPDITASLEEFMHNTASTTAATSTASTTAATPSVPSSTPMASADVKIKTEEQEETEAEIDALLSALAAEDNDKRQESLPNSSGASGQNPAKFFPTKEVEREEELVKKSGDKKGATTNKWTIGTRRDADEKQKASTTPPAPTSGAQKASPPPPPSDNPPPRPGGKKT